MHALEASLAPTLPAEHEYGAPGLAHHSAQSEAVRQSAQAPQTLLVLGVKPSAHPLLEMVPTVTDARAPFDAVLVAAPTPEGQVLDALARDERWLAPVVNLSGDVTRSDDFSHATLSDLSMRQGLDCIGRILERSASLAEAPGLCEEPGLRALAMAYTRARPLKACLAPDLPDLLAYPLMRGIDSATSVLEDLAYSNLVQPQFYQRVHVCSGCGSARVNVREECIECRSSHLHEESLVHHYRCGHQAEESRFRQGRDLVCPKCRRGLHHYAVDYDKPGTVQICQACEAIASEPAVGFLCADCGLAQDASKPATRDWFHYGLLPAGVDALRQGVLPHRSLQKVFGQHYGAMNPNDFFATAAVLASVAKRHSRPLSGLTLRIENIEQLTQEVGQTGLTSVYHQLGDIVTQALRDSDLVTVLDSVVRAVLPETSTEQAIIVQGRIEAEVRRVICVRLALNTESLSSEQVLALYGEAP